MLALLNMTNLNTILYYEYPKINSVLKYNRIDEFREHLQGLQDIVGIRGTVGYVSDIDPHKERVDFHKQVSQLQYAIAPIRIIPLEKSRFVIGIFNRSSAPENVLIPDSKLVKKFNDSLAVYVREVN